MRYYFVSYICQPIGKPLSYVSTTIAVETFSINKLSEALTEFFARQGEFISPDETIPISITPITKEEYLEDHI